jgi:hypothetical protein
MGLAAAQAQNIAYSSGDLNDKSEAKTQAKMDELE